MLSIKNLSKTYQNGVQALQDVSLEIPKGMFGLLGPNGAGKSTLMRTLATLQEPDCGSITLNGLDVLKQKHEVREILGYLPQEFGLYPKITAEVMLDHLAMLKGITQRGQRKELVAELLRMTNLWNFRKRKLGTYSGGMRQRFGIAQALIGEPKLIIVDEPTAGLDPEERNRFLNLLSRIGESIVVILSTHIVEDVSDLCTNMAIISEGRVLLTAEPRQAMAELQGSIWHKTIDRDQLDEAKKSWEVISSRLAGGRTMIHVLSPGCPADGFEPVAPDLKDVYFAILRRNQEQPTPLAAAA